MQEGKCDGQGHLYAVGWMIKVPPGVSILDGTDGHGSIRGLKMIGTRVWTDDALLLSLAD